MPRRITTFKKGGYYHIYNRGVNKNSIFFEEENYLFLIKKIKKYSSKFNISILAYCLMPNHYHLLIRQDNDQNISKFIQYIFNSYTKAVNKRYNRSGTLFEGRFKSVKVEERNYLIHLCSYIHRNPFEAGISEELGNWPYSNLPEWLDYRTGELYNNNFRNRYFKTGKEYLSFLKGYDLPDNCEKLLLD